ncbi:hypothetical protein BDZ90DRAFT_234689 [Jaminaea rosea]|uniref:RNA polymerase II subunit B1 CTD phosphatase RPAP2 homolog n=1 Tax=Jaminaea rosea TaxID=1569628 RepID=A0A316UII5_9BASI|nr:hypothetical protein BDZ90DRAFT_234689 [Jaminaea rosea]PWN24734.1 hypothetical protein BDZ90DRAFT_234689 [Jaminaea rosea]
MPTAIPNPSSALPPRRGPAPPPRQRQAAAGPPAQQQQQQQQQQPPSSTSASSSSRLPAAPSSLRVQLPHGTAASSSRSPPPPARRSSAQSTTASDDLLTSVLSRRRVTPTAPPAPAEAPTPPSTVPSDVSLLASSLLQQRAKSQAIVAAQEALIFPPPSSSGRRARTRQELKRSLTRLGSPHWLQVNQERALAGLCGYPCCSQPLPRRRPTPGGGARLRISVARGVIERDTRDEPGGRNWFCSDVCHARAEWVRRWVLADTGEDDGEGEEQNRRSGIGQGDEENPSSSFFAGDDLVDGLRASIASSSTSSDRNGGGLRALGSASALQGGKWEALTRRKEEDWRDIELLEDLQERGDLEGWEGFEAEDEREHEEEAQATFRPPAAAAAEASRSAPTTSAQAPNKEEADLAALASAAPTSSTLGFEDLVISERGRGAAALAQDVAKTAEEERIAAVAAARPSYGEEQEGEEAGEMEGEEDEEDEDGQEEPSEEEKMIEDAMRLREAMIGRGEWEE